MRDRKLSAEIDKEFSKNDQIRFAKKLKHLMVDKNPILILSRIRTRKVKSTAFLQQIRNEDLWVGQVERPLLTIASLKSQILRNLIT